MIDDVGCEFYYCNNFGWEFIDHIINMTADNEPSVGMELIRKEIVRLIEEEIESNTVMIKKLVMDFMKLSEL